MKNYIRVDGKTFRIDTQAADFVRITPIEAMELLQRNTGNRTLRPDHVTNLARDIVQGDWITDGSAVRFDTNGRLLDGQHRLIACARTMTPITTLLVMGISPKASVIMDTGAKRTAGDMLNMSGVTKGGGNNVAAAVRVLIGYVTGDLNKARATSSEIYNVVQKHPGIAQSVVTMGGCPIERALVSALHYTMCADGHEESAAAWRKTWQDGIPAYEGDPAHRLRERFLRERGAAVKAVVSVRRNLALNAYRHFLAKVPIRVLKEHADTRLAGWSMTRLGLPERKLDEDQ